MALTEDDLQRIEERTELAVFKAFERHRQQDHDRCEAACIDRAAKNAARLAAVEQRLDRFTWMGGGALALLALPWKKAVAFLAAMKGM